VHSQEHKKRAATMKRRRMRSERGQGIAEGAAAISMIIPVSIGACLLIFNSGSGIYFKQKLEGVTHLAAQYAAAHAGDSNVEIETETFVENIMPEVGMTPNNLNVDIEELSMNENPMVKVTVANSFQVFGGGSVLPSQITLAESECVVF
jgi:hypothetical protein